MTDNAFDVELGKDGKKQVTILVKAPGFKDAEQKVEVEGDTTSNVEMVKKPSSSGGGGAKPAGGGSNKKPPKQQPGGGLIDI